MISKRILKRASILLSITLLLLTACTSNEKNELQAAIMNAEATTTPEVTTTVDMTTMSDDLLIGDKGEALPPLIDEKGLGAEGTTAVVTTSAVEIEDKTEPPVNSEPSDTTAPVSETDEAAAILSLVNEYRAENNLPPLQLDAGLNQGAQIRAQELLQDFSHTRPDGRDFYTVLTDLKITYSYAAENVAYGLNKYSTPQEVMEGWINSEGHRANILSNKAKYLGVGLYTTNTSEGTYYYWAQLFAAF